MSFTFCSVARAQRWGRNVNSKQDQELLKRNVTEMQNQKAGFSVWIPQQEVSGTISNNPVTLNAPELYLGQENSTHLWKLQKAITREEKQLQVLTKVIQLISPQPGNVNKIHMEIKDLEIPSPDIKPLGKSSNKARMKML